MNRPIELPLADRLRVYAEEIHAVANLRTPGLVEALATIPREEFLGPGPWKIPFSDPDRLGELSYRETSDANPQHVYHNVLVALDASRHLNNGQPSSLCHWIDLLDLAPGGRVFHLGCGSGYYTALMAAVVGASGSVIAAEVDEELAALAARTLSRFAHADVRPGNGVGIDPGPVDAVLVNAGVTQIDHLWLDRLRDRGRLLVPITFLPPAASTSTGVMVLIRRDGERYRAKAIGPVAIFPADGGRSPESNVKLATAFAQGGWRKLQQLRRDRHDADATCWLHVDGACLSMATSD
jgi:protein-L-isoaspartate(D-aspartate) O-methyltransferase